MSRSSFLTSRSQLRSRCRTSLPPQCTMVNTRPYSAAPAYKEQDDESSSEPHAQASGRRDRPPAMESTHSNGVLEAESMLRDSGELTGAAKLLAEALEEEEELARSGKSKPRYMEKAELEANENSAWTGDESVKDAVIRMLMDANKPLRTEKQQSSETKIKDMLKRVDMSPRMPGDSRADENGDSLERVPITISSVIEAERSIPPSEFKPWHAKYVAKDDVRRDPSVRYGKFINDRKFRNVASLLDRPEIANDPKVRKALREGLQSEARKGRIVGAREGALDYRLGEGQPQPRGASAAGGSRGAPSGMRAWQNLVEDRIERARSSGWFDNVAGRGQPIDADPEQSNPFIDRSEFFMNRIVKRQGARPPWIELLQELETAQTAFRASILSSYVRAVVRSLTTSPYQTFESLSALTADDVSVMRDARWRRREEAYHNEAVRELNNTVRRMNTLAPQSVRRGLYTLERELELMYDKAGPLVIDELAKRRTDEWNKRKREGHGGPEDDDDFVGASRKAGDAGKTSWDFDMGGLNWMDAIRNLFRKKSN